MLLDSLECIYGHFAHLHLATMSTLSRFQPSRQGARDINPPLQLIIAQPTSTARTPGTRTHDVDSPTAGVEIWLVLALPESSASRPDSGCGSPRRHWTRIESVTQDGSMAIAPHDRAGRNRMGREAVSLSWLRVETPAVVRAQFARILQIRGNHTRRRTSPART